MDLWELFKNPHWHQSLSEFEFWVRRVPQHLSAHVQGHLEIGSNPISVPCWGGALAYCFPSLSLSFYISKMGLKVIPAWGCCKVR